MYASDLCGDFEPQTLEMQGVLPVVCRYGQIYNDYQIRHSGFVGQKTYVQKSEHAHHPRRGDLLSLTSPTDGRGSASITVIHIRHHTTKWLSVFTRRSLYGMSPP